MKLVTLIIYLFVTSSIIFSACSSPSLQDNQLSSSSATDTLASGSMDSISSGSNSNSASHLSSSQSYALPNLPSSKSKDNGQLLEKQSAPLLSDASPKPEPIPEEPVACHTLQAILKNASYCKDKFVEISGKVCEAKECQFIAPAAREPYSRNSWPFKQGNYCVYVFGAQPEAEEDASLTIKAYVRIINGQLYLQMQP
ncbi:MAG: hypothetical protein RML72_04120 [Bacteroidia bacterium]|nr:hypothetical protein [Bacteroidia bacterium]MDW8158049.1 hypothetical protein [Bacteroidia bacterium]